MKSKVILLVIFSTLLCGAWYYNTHFENIMAMRADYYYKNNNIIEAQNSLEKAFEAGLTDSNYRDIYVNSIINAPLNTDSQEKLVKFISYPFEDSAKLKAKYFLYDLKRAIHRKYPENFITQAVFNQKIVRWGEVPIKYGFVNTQDVPKYFFDEIEAAFTEWEKATDHQLLFEKEDNNPNIIINFNKVNPADEENQKYIVAYTVPQINIDKLKNMQINFYLKDPREEYFSQNQVYNTALHEIAHALGFMGHSNDKENIMYLSKDSMSVMNDLRESLTEADINTIKLLYKIKPDITNTDEAVGEYIPSLILGDEEEVTSAKIKEAKFYIKKAPNLSSGYIDLAEGYVAQGEYPKAIKSLEKALRVADTDEVTGMIYYNLAVSYYYINHTELAYDYLQKSMQIEDSDEKHFLLGEIYNKEEKFSKAINEYSNLIKKNPKNIEYVIALTNIYVVQKKYTSARRVLKNYIKNNPTDKDNTRLKSYGILMLLLQ